MGASTVTEVVDFSGGVNQLLAPHLIAKNEALALVNTDVRFGALQAMPLLNWQQSLDYGPYFYSYLRKIHSFPSFRSNVLWDNKWYWSDGLNTGKMLPDGQELKLGIDAPTLELEVIPTSTGPLEGNIKYTYTFYSIETGAESAPAPLPDFVAFDNESATLSGFEPLPVEATHYRLYRVGGYLPRFLMVDQFTIAPYTDALDDSRIDGRPLHTMRNGVPPSGLSNLTELNGRFYGSAGNKIYFSALANPDSWYISDFFTVRGHVVGLAATPAGILVLGQSSTSLLVGSDVNNFRLKLLSEQYGCLGKESIANLGDSVIWLSNKQIAMCNGYKIVDVTAFKLDRLVGLVPTGACVENETYYLSYKPSLYPENDLYPSDELFPATIEGASGTGQGMLAFDFKRGNNFSYKNIEYNEVRTVAVVHNEVMVSAGGYLLNSIVCDEVMFPSCEDTTETTVFSLFTMNIYQGERLTRLRYLSPTFMDSGLGVLKQYDKVRIQATGNFTIQVLFAGRVVVERYISSEANQPEQHLIGIPNNDNTAHSIQFYIEGTGTISSIQYSWKNREVPN